MALDPDLLRGGRRALVDSGHLVEDEAGDDREQHDRPCGPGELEVRVAADLRALGLARPAAAAVLDHEEDQRALDEHEDPAGDAEDQPVDVADVRGARRGGVRRRDAAVARGGHAHDHEREQRGCGEDGSKAAHGRWHSMNVPDRTRVQLPAGVGGTSRGLRQRRRAAARAGLPTRGRRARLRPLAGARREARLLALAVALPRRRRHLPAERQRRRGVRAGRPARGRRRATARDRRLARQLDGRVVHEHAWPLDAQPGGPARHRVENRVELLVGALLDPDLPALSLELDEVGAGERDEVADELGRGGRRRRLDGDGADWRLPRRRRSLEGSSAPVRRRSGGSGESGRKEVEQMKSLRAIAVLLVVAACVALAGAALASKGSKPARQLPHSTKAHQATPTAKPAAGDTDNVQSGEQNAPRSAGTAVFGGQLGIQWRQRARPGRRACSGTRRPCGSGREPRMHR